MKKAIELTDLEIDLLHEEFESLEYRNGSPITYLWKDKKRKYLHSNTRKKWRLFMQENGYEI